MKKSAGSATAISARMLMSTAPRHDAMIREVCKYAGAKGRAMMGLEQRVGEMISDDEPRGALVTGGKKGA